MTTGLLPLFRARARIFWNNLISLRRHSNLKLVVIVFFALVLWAGFFWLFYDGFRFLDRPMMRDFRDLLVEIMFAVFFLSLFAMLLFSNGIIAYGSLFRSPETAFLFTHPIAAWRIYLYKLSETLLFSSWAFLFLALPLIVAFGVVDRAPWFYYPGAALFFVAFAMLSAGLGGLVTLLIARVFTQSPRRVLGVLTALILAIAIMWALGLTKAYRVALHLSGATWMRGVLGKLAVTRSPVLPSYWASSGIQYLARGGEFGREALYRFSLLFSTALFLGMLGAHAARRCYTDAYHRTQARARRRRRKAEALGYRIFGRLLIGIRPKLRILIVKDLKTFLRDPVQWSQVLIFFGLLGVYFLNMRHVQSNLENPFWNNLINLLNLVATSLTMSTFTSRFIFPLVSLEGRRFWILSLLPVEKRDLIYSKFWFAFVGSFLISETLIGISDTILRVARPVMLLHGLTVAVICAGLSGLSVGIGAIYPNLRETNPSKIVSGFGGTLNLVLSLGFVGATIVLAAVPYHLGAMNEWGEAVFTRGAIVGGTVLAVLLGALTTVLPLYLGVRAFERLEA